MVRLFSHWFPTNTVVQMAFDAILFFLTFMLVVLWRARGEPPSIDLLPSALLFAMATVALNSTVGLYRRDRYRTGLQNAARVIVLLLLAVPAAYAILDLLPWEQVHQEALKVTAVAIFAALVAVRSFVA